MFEILVRSVQLEFVVNVSISTRGNVVNFENLQCEVRIIPMMRISRFCTAKMCWAESNIHTTCTVTGNGTISTAPDLALTTTYEYPVAVSSAFTLVLIWVGSGTPVFLNDPK